MIKGKLTPAPTSTASQRHALKARFSRKQRHFFDDLGRRPKRGQAAIEYVLLVAITSLIFGAMFYAIRQSVFRLWVCDITPRVESAAGCNFQDRPCYSEPSEVGPARDICSKMPH